MSGSAMIMILGYVLYPLIAFLISMSLTALCIRILPKLGFIDNPGGRHIHERVVPRGGGVAIALAVFFTVAAQVVASNNTEMMRIMFYSLLPGGLIIITGLVDDRIGLKSVVKLLLQIAAAVMIWYGMDRELTIYGYVLPWYVSLGVTVLWIVGVINAFNMVDGLDGLATGLAVISGLCLSAWFLFRQDYLQALCMLIFVGACLGFLRYNFAPAKIFLGDTGSMFLGLFLAVSGGGTLDITATFTTLLLPVLIIGVPIFDMVLAVLRRSVRKVLNPQGAGLMDADSDHLHHRLFRKDFSHRKAATRMYIIGTVFAVLALLLLLLRDRASAVALIVILLVALVMLRRLAVIELFDSVSLLRKSLQNPRKSLLCMAAHPILDLIMIGMAAMVSCYVVTGMIRSRYVAFAVLPVLITLVLSGSYRVFWLRTTLSDRARLFISAVIGCLISAAVLCFGRYNGNFTVSGNFEIGVALFVLLVPMALSAERFFLHYLEQLWYQQFTNAYRRDVDSYVLFIGGGLRCRLATVFFGSCQRAVRRESIIGLLDDDPRLAGKHCYDLPVLGKISELADVYRRRKFDRVLITATNLSDEQLAGIKAFCRENKVKCTEFVLFSNSAELPDRSEDIKVLRNRWMFLADLAGVVVTAGVCSLLLFHKLFTVYVIVTIAAVLMWMLAGGVSKVLWGSAGIGDRWRLMKSTIFGAAAGHVVYACWLFIAAKSVDEWDYIAVMLIYIIMISAWTQVIRIFFHPLFCCRKYRKKAAARERVLIFGGGLYCRVYLQSLKLLGGQEADAPVGIIDDDNVLHGLRCHGLPVLGGSGDLAAVYERRKFDRIVIATNRISGETLSAIGKFADEHKILCGNFVVMQREL